MNPSFITTLITRTMTKTPPTQTQQSASSSRLGKVAVLATAIAAFAAPSANALGIVTDTQTLSIAPTGVLDLKVNNLVVRTGTFATIYGYVQTGLTGGVNGWDGPGINSSVASAALGTNAAYAVGILDNSAFGGAYVGAGAWPPVPSVTLTGTEILAKYTYWGDCDLDGIMTLTDQGLFNDGYSAFINSGTLPQSSPGGGWFNGDMDFDNAMTLTDQGFFNNGFAEYLATSVALSPGEESLGAGVAVVPEPSAVLLLSSSILGLLLQRRRNRTES